MLALSRFDEMAKQSRNGGMAEMKRERKKRDRHDSEGSALPTVEPPPAWTPFRDIALTLRDRLEEDAAVAAAAAEARAKERQRAKEAEDARAAAEAQRAQRQREERDPEAAFAAAFGGADPLPAGPDRAASLPPLSESSRTARRQPPARFESEADRDFLHALFEIGAEATWWSQPGSEHEGESLARGSYAIDDEVDLHGCDEQQARDRLRGAITDALARRVRVLRIVHGKGIRSPDGKGKLRTLVRLWLQRPPLRNHLVAYAGALPGDGGDGATIVLLRRPKVVGRSRRG